jgi:SsrA-binding protein
VPAPKKATAPGDIRIVATNRRARHEYFVEEAFEAGLALAGSEVKSLRESKASLADAYAAVKDGEVWLMNAHIPPYKQSSLLNHEPLRPRKLLLHRQEIRRIQAKAAEQGYTLVPLRLYFKDNRAKVEVALAKGKRAYDKRQTIAAREAEREMAKRRGTLRRRG